MKLAYLHIFVRRGWRSNANIRFLVQEAQNVAVLWRPMLGKLELFRGIIVSSLSVFLV